MLSFGLFLLAGLAVTQSLDIAHHTGVGGCVYTFNVQPTDNMCPPGAQEASGGMEDLKETMETQHSHISEQIQNLTRIIAELSRPKVDGGNGAGNEGPVFRSGTHYTRWGHSACPATAQLLYTGYAGKSSHNKGGGIDYQCLPVDPEFHEDALGGYQSQSYMYGVEYEKHNSPVFPDGRNNNDVPCAVCHVNDRGEEIMIPAKMTCPAGWTKEYDGLLMAQHHSHHASNYVCVDKEMEILPGGYANQNGGLLYVVEAVCGSLLCPPYRDGFELPCVVCTL